MTHKGWYAIKTKKLSHKSFVDKIQEFNFLLNEMVMN